jgi:putative cell wall-binding protein
MSKKTKQKLINCFMAAAFVLSSTLTPLVANAATISDPSSVTRIGGVDRFETAALMAQKGWTGTSDNVVLSAGMDDNLVDALSAGPLAFKLNAPILLTDGGQTLNSFAKVELQRLKPKKVYLTSGTGVIKPSIIEELKALGITPVQLGGLDRYETSVNIAKELALQGANISRVVLAGGWASSADALSVSSIAATQGMPILATAKDQLPAPVKAYLDSIKAKITDSYVIGGTGVVSDAVKGELPGKVSRYSGLNRYDTNVQVLKNFAKEYKNDIVYVANGESLVDAVAGVPLAAANRSAVVLVNQPIDNATKEFVKLNMSTDHMVALGGEGAVSAAGVNALTSVVSYATDSATVGSTDSTTPLVLTDNVRITGDNVSLKNAKTDYSVYVKGNNVTLKNLTVKGTVFVDPGKTGSATLDGVTAGNIVILSGAPHSVIITNSASGQITVSSDGNTNIVLTSVTTNGVSVQTAVVYETDQAGNQVKTGTITITSGAGNNLGEMTITSDPGKTTDVNLSGEFKQPIKVEGQGGTTISAAAGTIVSSVTSNTNTLTLAGAGTYTAVVAQSGTLTAATGTVLPSVTVATTSPTQTVTLAGNITNVTQTQGNTTLAAGTTVTNMTTTGSSTILVPPGSSIGNLVSTGTTAPSIGGGGTVNDETTPIIPPVTPPPVTPPPSGGGGLPQLSVPTVTAMASDGSHAALNNVITFSNGNDNTRLTGLQLTGSPDNIVISSINARGMDMIDHSISVPVVNNVVTTQALFGALDQGTPGITMANLRFVFGSQVTLKGWISKSGYRDSGEITIIINLGTSIQNVSTIDNQWMTIHKEGPKSVSVTIKANQSGVTLGQMTNNNFNFVQVVTAIALGSVNVNDGNNSGEALRQQIISRLGNVNYSNITLGELGNRTIDFGDGYSVTFVQPQLG